MSSDEKNEGSENKAYITSDGRYIDPTDGIVHDELKKPRQINKKEETNIPSQDRTNKKNIQSSKSYKKQSQEIDYQVQESDNDLFDEDGNILEEEESAKLKELEDKIEETLTRIKDIIDIKIKKPFLKVRYKVLGILSRFLNPITFVITKFSSIIERVAKKSGGNIPIEKSLPPPVEVKLVHGNFEDMISLNITFTDNYDVPLYKRRGVALANSEENLILLSAKDAIVQCAEFTVEMPDVQEGMFAGRKVSELMENVEEENITLFLGYVKKRPQKYIAKSWKISETYATWLVNNTPVIDENE